jgi:hypothetical protein
LENNLMIEREENRDLKEKIDMLNWKIENYE